ncbi:MAG: serine hydrolase domain-containing protein [Kofleriaceae bacterium]
MHARRALLPVVLLAVWACVHCAPVSPRRAPIDEDMPRAGHAVITDAPETIEELKRRIAEVLEAENAPGAVIGLVDRDGPIWIGGIGVRDLATRAPMQADTVFRVGSLTKSIIALGVMRLADQGKLDVDAPLRELLPGLVDNPWESVAPVTLAQCLEHTAGLDDLRFNEIFTTDEWQPLSDALAMNPRSREVRWRPGTRHAYSNVGYTLAARAIEVASGEPFDVYLRREILAPLEIHEADFGRTPGIRARLATGYEDGEARTFHVFAHRAAGSLLTSAEDLTKLVHFWIRRGEGYPPIVSAAGLARIERSGTLPYPHIDNEYGFANYGDVWHPTMAHGHDGGMPGFHASYRYFSELGVGYVMLLNSTYTLQGYVQLRTLLYSYLTRDRPRPTPPPPAPAAAPPAAPFYAHANPRNEFFGFIDEALLGYRIDDRDDVLRVTLLSGTTFRLVPTADGGYRWPDECGSSTLFTTGVDGTPIMLMHFTYAEATPSLFARIRYTALAFTVTLLHLVPLWTIAHLLLSALRRRRSLPLWLVVPPAVAGLCCVTFRMILVAAFERAVIGIVHPLTVAFCGVTLLFALASVTTLVSTIRWALRPDQVSRISLVIPAVCGIAFTGLALWLGANGWIGLRTWAW